MQPLKALLFLCIFATGSSVHAMSDFFKIHDIRYLAKAVADRPGIWTFDRTNRVYTFEPCIEVKLSAAQTVRSEGLNIRAYFLGPDEKLIATAQKPELAIRNPKQRSNLYDVPVIFREKAIESVFFRLPKEISNQKWSVVVVFGDKDEADARKYPNGEMINLDFPGKELALKLPNATAKRSSIKDPVFEHKVNTQNPKHPQITLFLRMPSNISNPSQIRGVMAMCTLANSLEDIRRRLQKEELSGGPLNFADKEKLAIVCWGARTLWRPGASHDELERETNRELDLAFDKVASAWERGVLELHKLHGIPDRNYLLWGMCGAAQWAHRLALRKPDYFLAAYIHIPSSFDKPTPEAAKILWLLTTGELDGGYERGARFFLECRDAGYPIIYKPIVGLGHATSPIADNLGLKFFEYALSVRDQRAKVDEEWLVLKRRGRGLPREPWLESFRKPAYVGDYLNQEIFLPNEQQKIPAALRVPLPTKTIAESWNR